MKSKIQGGAAWGWENTRIRKNGLKTCILYDVMHFRGIWGSWISIALELTACENASLRGKWQPASVIIYWHKQQVCLLVLIRPTQHRLSDGICSFVWACGWEQYSKSLWGALPSASGSFSPGGLGTAGEGSWMCWFFLGCQELCCWDSLHSEGVWVAGMLRRQGSLENREQGRCRG